MKKKAQSEPSSHARRAALASDVEQFLKSGHKIQQIPSGVSSHDPQGRGKPLHTTTTKTKTTS